MRLYSRCRQRKDYCNNNRTLPGKAVSGQAWRMVMIYHVSYYVAVRFETAGSSKHVFPMRFRPAVSRGAGKCVSVPSFSTWIHSHPSCSECLLLKQWLKLLSMQAWTSSWKATSMVSSEERKCEYIQLAILIQCFFNNVTELYEFDHAQGRWWFQCLQWYWQ